MSDAMSAKVKVGEVSYVRYIYDSESYLSVEGHTFHDKNHTWKSKVDRKTGKRYYVNLGSYGKKWTLPGKYPPEGFTSKKPAREPSQDRHPASNARSPKTPGSLTPDNVRSPGKSPSPAFMPPPPQQQQQQQQQQQSWSASGSEMATVSLLDVYKQRLPFNPSASQLLELPPDVTSRIRSEMSTADITSLRLEPDAYLSAYLTALYYIHAHPDADVAAVVHKLCYAIAADSQTKALASPFLECETKMAYLSSVNDSIYKLVADNSSDLQTIRANIAVRQQERKQAAAKMEEWMQRCAESDHEVTDALAEGFNVATAVEAYLRNIRDVADLMREQCEADATTCSASLERLRSELQERCNLSRSLQDAYVRLKSERSDLHRSLASLSRDETSEAVSLRDAVNTLQQQLSESRADNVRLTNYITTLERTKQRSDLPKAQSANPVPDELVRDLHAKLSAARAEIANLKRRLNTRNDAISRNPKSESPSRDALVSIIQQQKDFVHSLMETDDRADDMLLHKCLQAAQAKIRQQRTHVQELKSLLTLCLELRDSPDDPIRALINATVKPADTRDDEAIMLDDLPLAHEQDLRGA